MLVLGIESSCDETSLALLEGDYLAGDEFYTKLNSFRVLGSVVSSQIETHAQYGGVVPEIGARQHAQQIHFLLEQVLQQAMESKNISNFQLQTSSLKFENGLDLLSHLDCIYVTTEPGLASALRVGKEFAKTLQFFIRSKYSKEIQIKSINHLRGHVASCFYELSHAINNEPDGEANSIFPHLHLLVSGGNSQIILLKSWTDWQIVGQTLDDAAGECLDKIGRMVGLPYPAGVKVAKIAGLEKSNPLNLPIGMSKSGSIDYSFSGLKTAVRYLVQKQDLPGFEFEQPLTDEEIELLLSSRSEDLNAKLAFIKQLCISAQFVVVTQLVSKFKSAIKQYAPVSCGLSGGVSANLLLRQEMGELVRMAHLPNARLFLPALKLTGDNAVMIALTGIADAFSSDKFI